MKQISNDGCIGYCIKALKDETNLDDNAITWIVIRLYELFDEMIDEEACHCCETFAGWNRA